MNARGEPGERNELLAGAKVKNVKKLKRVRLAAELLGRSKPVPPSPVEESAPRTFERLKVVHREFVGERAPTGGRGTGNPGR